MARPSKYTPEAVSRILQALEVGTPYKHAAAFGGISEDTFSRWLKRHADFAESVKAAESRAMVGRLVRIRQAETESWQAAAWWLERRYPTEFGRKTVSRIEVDDSRQMEEIASQYGVSASEIAAALAKNGRSGR
jgi:transposase